MAKTYDTYKDSGIAWIGEIPGDWEVCRYKNICTIQSGFPFDSSKFSVQKGFPLIRIRDITSGKIETYYDGYYPEEYVVKKGDLIIGMDGDFNVRLWQNEDGLLNQRCCRLYEKKCANKSFLFYTLPMALRRINDLAYATTVKHLSNNDIYNSSITLPPLSVQQSISSFLDTKCGEIDSLISIQEEMISELLAYKQSVITEAVTKGLDKKAKMKNSGVEWIGDIPEEWEVKPYKAIFYTEKGLNITKADLVEKGEPVLSYGQIHSKMNTGTKINDALLKYVPSSYIETNPECLVQKGCFLIADTSEDYEGCGNAIYVDKDMTLFAGYHTIVARPIHNNGDYKYLAYLFLTDIWRQQIRSRVSGIKVYSINQKIIRLTSVLLPPLPVQQAIATYLDEKTSQIDSLIALKQSKIESLKEYKKSIIYEYVTGKKRV